MEFHDNENEETVAPTVKLPSLEGAKRRFRSAIDSTDAARDAQALDRSYFDGTGTISEEWKATLVSHKLVSPSINIVRNIVSGYIGVVEAQPHDPEAWPRTPGAQGGADIATKALRYACDRAQYDSVKSDCVENYFIEGVMAAIVRAEAPHALAASQINNIKVERIHPDEFFFDPHSRDYDFRDALYMGIARWAHVSEIHQQYPDSEQYGHIEAGDLLGANNRTMRDSPDVWVDRKEKRVLVVEMYYKDAGQWRRIVFCHAGILDFGDSGYVDDDGLSICPIVAMSCFINMDKDNDALTYARFGVIRDMQGPSNEYNCHRAIAIKSSISRTVQQTNPDAMPVDASIVRSEAARPDGIIPPGWSVVPTTHQQDHTALLQLASAEIARMGPTPAVLGRSLSDSQSGRSRMVQQQAGMTELAPVLGRIERWENAIFRHIWFTVRQYWKDEFFIRVSGQAKAPEFLSVNVPKVEMRLSPIVGPDGQPQIDPMTGQPAMAPQPVTVGMDNELAKIDVDIQIVAVNETASLQHEVRQQIIELAQVAPVGSPQFLALLKIFPFTNKTETLDEIKAIMEELQQAQSGQQQAQAEQAQAAQQIQGQQAQAKTANLVASAQKHGADAQRTTFETKLMGANAALHLAQMYQSQPPSLF